MTGTCFTYMWMIPHTQFLNFQRNVSWEQCLRNKLSERGLLWIEFQLSRGDRPYSHHSDLWALVRRWMRAGKEDQGLTHLRIRTFTSAKTLNSPNRDEEPTSDFTHSLQTNLAAVFSCKYFITRAVVLTARLILGFSLCLSTNIKIIRSRLGISQSGDYESIYHHSTWERSTFYDSYSLQQDIINTVLWNKHPKRILCDKPRKDSNCEPGKRITLWSSC